MRIIVFVWLFLCCAFAEAQSASSDGNTKNETQKARDSSHIPLAYIAFTCKGDDARYIIIDSSAKWVLLYVTDKSKKNNSDSLFLDFSYDDGTVSDFLEHKLKDSNSTCFAEKKNLLLMQVREKINTYFQQAFSSKDKTIIDSLENELEREFTAGQIRSIASEVPIYNWNGILSFTDTSKKVKVDNIYSPYLRKTRAKDTVFSIEKIAIRTDYNRISKISVTGKLKYRDTTLKKDTSLHLVLINPQYSLSLSAINDGQYVLKLPVLSTHSLYINFADVIQYEPFGGEMSYIIANQSIDVPVGGTANLKKRKLSDYISFRTFLDPLGFLGSNPNGFAQLEGDAIIPMALRSKGKMTFLPQANVNFNYIYSNSINLEPRIAPVYELRNSLHDTAAVNNPLLTASDTSRFASNLDFIRYSYYQLRANFSIAAMELKSFSSWLHFEAGVRVSGSKMDTTSGRMRTIHKFIPEIRLRLEIRPDYIIGASMSVGVAWLGNAHQGNNAPQNIRDISFLYNSPVAIPHEVNLYAVTGSGTGGLFFRYAAWLAFHQKLSGAVSPKLPSNIEIRKTSYFPQILVGYATNLSALVNRVPKQRSY